MPLSKSSLAAALADIASDPPATAAACASAWAEAIGDYASSVVPPVPSVSAAQATLSSALAGAFASPAAAPLMELAFTAFGATLGLSMAPAFTAVPPAGPVGFAAQFAGPKPTTHSAAGAQLADLIDAWMKTGSATPSIGGPPVSWS